MKKKKADEANSSGDGSAESLASRNKILPSGQAILDGFRRTSNLTTIQLKSTIVHEDSDNDRGAKPFREIIEDLFKNLQEPSDLKPRALWVVSDTAGLEHVLREMRKHNTTLFNDLNAHASVALVSGAKRYLELLSKTALAGANSDLKQALTACPKVSGSGYDYLAHFKASAKAKLKSGLLPVCVPIDDTPEQLDEFLLLLHKAHDERISGIKGANIKSLEQSGVQFVSLEELIGAQSSSYQKK